MSTVESKIPIQNIYYLLTYAWDCLEESTLVNIDASDSNDLLELLTSVLLNGTNHLLKRGLDRGYINQTEDSACPRGRINLKESLSRLLHLKARLNCSHDELSHDILHNQIIKASISYLLGKAKLKKDLHQRLHATLQRFSTISDIKLSATHFRRVQLNRNNHFYSFLLHVCELIHESLLPTEEDGSIYFRDFLRDRARMARLFENFVRNFYHQHLQRRHPSLFTVKSEQLHWALIPSNEQSKKLIPTMRTDISLTSPTRKIIIDTKFYENALTYSYDKTSLNSANLYQLQTYLTHADPGTRQLEGILLYPSVNDELRADYSYQNFKLKVRTINLAQDWRKVSADLMAVVGGE